MFELIGTTLFFVAVVFFIIVLAMAKTLKDSQKKDKNK
jgi:preprotein translocase subunit SecG